MLARLRRVGDLAIRGIDDQRRSGLKLPLWQPEGVVVASARTDRLKLLRPAGRGPEDLSEERRVARVLTQLLSAGLQCRELLGSQLGLFLEALRPLERCGTVVGPDAREVGMPLGRPGNGPLLGGLSVRVSGASVIKCCYAATGIYMTAAAALLRESASVSTPHSHGTRRRRDTKMSRRVSRRVARPACIAGVRVSRPNFSAPWGRTKL